MCCACRPALRVRSAVRVSVSLCMLHDAHPHGHGVPGCGAPPPCWECTVSGPRGESKRQRTRPWEKRGCKTPGEILALWQGAVLICAPVSVHVCYLSASVCLQPRSLAARSCQGSAEGQSGNERGATHPPCPPLWVGSSPAYCTPHPCRHPGSRFRRLMLLP